MWLPPGTPDNVHRPPSVGALPCPRPGPARPGPARPGHEPTFAFGVSLDGKYGREPVRQRYRRTAPDCTFHRFTPPLPREHTTGGVCTVCDTHVAAHAGPGVSRAYRHRLHLIAEALIVVGRGVSYTRAVQGAASPPVGTRSQGTAAGRWSPNGSMCGRPSC